MLFFARYPAPSGLSKILRDPAPVRIARGYRGTALELGLATRDSCASFNSRNSLSRACFLRLQNHQEITAKKATPIKTEIAIPAFAPDDIPPF